MENAIWNNNTIIASDISKDYEKEKLIRKASGRRELYCPDPDCKHPILKYCHGEIKVAFFSHLNNFQCDYADFDKENTSLMREVKLKLFDSFRSLGYQIQMDVKIIERHYTHLLITQEDKSQIAIELGTQRMTANKMDYLTSEYRKKGINIKWLVISNAQEPVKESETFFMKRYQLNESTKKDVLILNWDGTELVQHIEDKQEYAYKGHKIVSNNYPDIYSEIAPLEFLAIEDGELSIKGFHERFHNWLGKKQSAFQKKLQELEKQAREAQKREELWRQQKEKQAREAQKREELWRQQKEKEKAKYDEYVRQQNEKEKQREEERRQFIEYKQNIEHGLVPEDVLSKIDQQIEQVRDKYDCRWIKCEICGKVAPENQFNSYGGPGHINLGRCNNCTHNK